MVGAEVVAGAPEKVAAGQEAAGAGVAANPEVVAANPEPGREKEWVAAGSDRPVSRVVKRDGRTI